MTPGKHGPGTPVALDRAQLRYQVRTFTNAEPVRSYTTSANGSLARVTEIAERWARHLNCDRFTITRVAQVYAGEHCPAEEVFAADVHYADRPGEVRR